MIAIALLIAVAVAAALKQPRGPVYWMMWAFAALYFFLIGPFLFGPGGIVAVGGMFSTIAVYGGAIGLLLLAIKDGRQSIASPNAEENERVDRGDA